MEDRALLESADDMPPLQLTEGAPWITEGEPQLTEGAAQLTAGVPQLTKGVQLTEGVPPLTEGVPQLTKGVQLTEGVPQLTEGAAQLTAGVPQLTKGVQLTEGVPPLTEGVPQLTKGVQLTEGVPQLTKGVQLTEGVPPLTEGVPRLTEAELYHVFLSYSSTDSQWVDGLLEQLEACGLSVCSHQRDFTAGRAILENMSECIAQSQKVMLVLSPGFLSSRWCQLEAHISLSTDSLWHKPVIPVLLRPVPIPLHLAHLTYLEAQHPDFTKQLLQVLYTPNHQLQSSTVVPCHPPSLYNGKKLSSLSAANKEQINRYNAGLWSTVVPDQLRPIIQKPQRYLEAIEGINKVHKKKVRFSSVETRVCFVCVAIIISLLDILFFLHIAVSEYSPATRNFLLIIFVLFSAWMFWKICTCKKNEAKRIVRKLQNAVGRANCLLYEENILMGCVSNSKLYVVYVNLSSCRSKLGPHQFPLDLLEFSSSYACCLAKCLYPFTPHSTAHLEGGVCFCQYVEYKNSEGEGCSATCLLTTCCSVLRCIMRQN